MKFLYDLFPLLLFFAAYKTYDIYAATAVAIVASFAQVGFHWHRHHRVETTHVVTLVVIAVFGGLTLLLRDNTFIKLKPTIVSWVFAAILLGTQFIGRKTAIERLLSGQIDAPGVVWSRLNLAWTAFFLATGALNLYVAFAFGAGMEEAAREQIWVNFKVWGMLGLTLLFAIAQGVYLARYAHVKSDQPES